jgi:RecB family exonuclease
MNEHEVSNLLSALGVLPAAAAALSPSARKHLEAAAEREAPNMTAQGRKMTLRGCEVLKLRTPSAFL